MRRGTRTATSTVCEIPALEDATASLAAETPLRTSAGSAVIVYPNPTPVHGQPTPARAINVCRSTRGKEHRSG